MNSKKSILISLAIMSCVVLLAASAVAQSAPKSSSGQASLTLWSCNAGACNGDSTSWALGKCEGAGCTAIPANNTDALSFSGGGPTDPALATTPPGPNTPVVWQVQVQGFASTPTTFKVFGFVDMQNTGSDTAYLGSLVINLQTKSGGTQFATVSSDVLTSAAGDTATTAWTCAGASSDQTTGGVYSENSGSGPLKLYDALHNDFLSHPYEFQNSLAVGERKKFLYEADFNLDALHIKAGDQIRIEALVTFSNAGPRGGSGASCTQPAGFNPNDINSFEDINGDGKYTTDEAYFRTVPCRVSFTVPPLEHHNQTVTLNDVVSNAADQPVTHLYDGGDLFAQSAGLTPVNLAGTLNVTWAQTDIGPKDHAGFGSGLATITSNGSAKLYQPNSVQAKVSITPDSFGNAVVGLDNCATLVGDAADDLVILNDPNSTDSFTFTCSTATNLKACAWPLYKITGVTNGCTYSQGGWGAAVHGTNPGFYLHNYWSTVYPSGSLTIGGNGGAYTMTFQGGTKNVDVCVANCNGKPANKVYQTQTVTFTGADSVEAYLPAKGTPAKLSGSILALTNPTDSSSGVFGGQVLALQLSVDFGDHHVGWAPNVYPVGDITYTGAGCENGVLVRNILADANRVLGGGSLPASCSSVGALNTVLDSIIQSFDGCNSATPGRASSGLSFTSN